VVENVGDGCGLEYQSLEAKPGSPPLVSNVPHDLRTNGSIELPIGPGKLFFGNSSGTLGRVLERWQAGIILNLSAGRPSTILGGGGLNYGSSTLQRPNIAADLVGNFNVRNATLYFDGPRNRAAYSAKTILT
jgi:hypothetical protein